MPDDRAVEPLIVALEDVESNVCIQASLALANIKDKHAVDALISMLKTQEESSAFAAFALGEIGDQQALTPLLDGLAGNYGDSVRHFAAVAVGKLEDDQAYEPLISALKENDVIMRIAAAEGLGYLGNANALSALEWVQQQDNGIDEFGMTVKKAATKAIKRIKSNKSGRSKK
jgi:HEAT repeat protein